MRRILARTRVLLWLPLLVALAATPGLARVEAAAPQPLRATALPTPPALPTPAGQPTPAGLPAEAAARDWMTALVELDGNAILKYTCVAERERVQRAVAAGAIVPALAGSTVEPEADLTDVSFELLEESASTARIAVSGELRAAAGARAQAIALDDVWEMARERGTWRWCGSESGKLPGAGGEAAVASGPTFATPEDAIRHYLGALAHQDVPGMLEAWAIDEKAAGFDFAGMIDRLRSFQPFSSLAPSGHPFFVEINRARVSGDALRSALNLSYSLLSDVDLVEKPIIDPDPEMVAAIMQALDPERLAALEVARIWIPEPELMNGERNRENFARSAAIWGADEQTERMVLVEFEGSPALVGFTLLRYGDGWKIASPTSAFGNTSVLGTAQRISEADAKALPGGE